MWLFDQETLRFVDVNGARRSPPTGSRDEFLAMHRGKAVVSELLAGLS